MLEASMKDVKPHIDAMDKEKKTSEERWTLTFPTSSFR